MGKRSDTADLDRMAASGPGRLGRRGHAFGHEFPKQFDHRSLLMLKETPSLLEVPCYHYFLSRRHDAAEVTLLLDITFCSELVSPHAVTLISMPSAIGLNKSLVLSTLFLGRLHESD